MTKLRETLDILAKARERSPAALVAYSGGKDSLCVMEMAVKTFDHVEGFFKYLVPGLDYTRDIIADCKERWGVHVHEVISDNVSTALAEGIFCDPVQGMKPLNPWNVYAMMTKKTGIPIILDGFKRSDSQSRRRFMKWTEDRWQVIHPLAGWQKADVLGYLRSQNIPLPASSGKQMSGITLHVDNLIWMMDDFPKDFERVKEFFPYVQAVAERRRFYGS